MRSFSPSPYRVCMAIIVIAEAMNSRCLGHRVVYVGIVVDADQVLSPRTGLPPKQPQQLRKPLPGPIPRRPHTSFYSYTLLLPPSLLLPPWKAPSAVM